MEPYIKDESGITYKSELTPHHFLWMAGIYSLRVGARFILWFYLKSAFSKSGGGLIRRRWKLVNEAATICVTSFRKSPAH